jgi:hypothetical protein
MTTPSPVTLPGDEDLSAAERSLLGNAVTGCLTDLRNGDAELDDPANGATWDASRQVRAELLIELLCGTRHPDSRPLRAVKLRGARITGPLDLEAATITCPLLLHECYIGEPVDFDEAAASAIRLPGCHLPAFTARQLHVTGDLNLDFATFTAAGEVNLEGARIGGQLSLDGASLTNPGETALNADNLSTDQGMFCSGGFTATGEISLRGARIGGELDLDGATVTNPGGTALLASNVTVGLSMSCGYGFTATGEINLDGGQIGSGLTFAKASLSNPDGTALSAEGLTVDQSVYCGDGFTATGEIRLPGASIAGELNLNGARIGGELNLDGARIGGQLNLDGSTITNPGETALLASNVTVGHSMSCGNGFTATGEINLDGAHIGSGLTFAKASLTNPDGTALSAEGLTIDQSVYCGDGFTVTGEINVDGAHIGGELNLNGATLTNPGETALSASNVTVGHSMSCGYGFTVTGEINLDGAHISSELTFAKATLSNPDGTALSAEGLTVDQSVYCWDEFTATGEISLRGARIAGELNLDGASLSNPAGSVLDFEAANIKTLRLPQERPDGKIDLTNAKVGVFGDNQEGWPAVLYLWGFVYDSLENQDINTRARLQWLKLTPGSFTPQLYDQLAAAYRRAGDEPAARTVAVAKQWRRRHAFNPLNYLWYVTVGYGYRTWLAGIWLAVLVALGTWVFSGAYPAHMIAISSHPPAFHAAVYALDLLLPVIGLGQKSAWQPQGSALLYWSWALTVAGWVLATAVVAGLTGILKRD